MKFAYRNLLLPQNGQMLAAALIWSGVGIMLLFKALLYCPSGISPQTLLTLAILCAGTLKSRFILDRTAEKNIARIKTFTHPRFIGAVYPPALWLVVLAMIGAGLLLKYLLLPTILLSFIYGTVGWGLLFSSRNFWQAWRQFKKESK